MNIAHWPQQWRRFHPDKTAVVELASGRRLAYARLADRIDALAAYLAHTHRVAAGQRVAVLSFNRVNMIECLFACAGLQAIMVPLNCRLTSGELEYILGDCTPTLLIHDPEHTDTARTLSARLGLALAEWLPDGFRDAPACLNQPPALPASRPDSASADTLLQILYTSGTTGRPKGVLITHGMVGWNALNTSVTWDLSGNDVTLTHTPLFHTGGMHVLTTPLLLRGGTIVLMQHFDPGLALAQVAAERCSILFAVPTMFQMMRDHPDFARADLSSIRFAISGGAPCPLPIIEAYQQRDIVFKQGYGLTEMGPNCLTLHEAAAVRKMGSVGFPNFFTEARITGPAQEELPRGKVGELWLRGPMACAGYWQQPDATANLFHEGWLKTGDLARLDEEGYCTIVDRKKDMFISGGENVYPAEIEAVLVQHPAIAAAAVIGVPHPHWGEVGRAILELMPGHTVDDEALLAFLQPRLARYKWPRSFIRVDALPRNSTGKLQKTVLRERYP